MLNWKPVTEKFCFITLFLSTNLIPKLAKFSLMKALISIKSFTPVIVFSTKFTSETGYELYIRY